MRTILIIFASVLLFSFQQANEYYHIIKVEGSIMNTATGKPLAPGDDIKPNVRLKFDSPYATALVISNTRGKFTLKYQSAESKDLFNDKKELLAMADNSVTPIDSRGMLATRGISFSDVHDLKTYFGPDNFYVIGKNLSVKLNKTIYPLNDNQYIVFSYSLNNESKSKKIGFDNQMLKIDGDALASFPKDSSAPMQIKDVSVYKLDKSANKSDLITKMNIVFLDEDKLKSEFDVIIPFLKDQKMDRFKVLDYLKSYFNDVYGNTDQDVLFSTINKELGKYF